jgi:UTP:GlnB (protein PII) uridylyltransferase
MLDESMRGEAEGASVDTFDASDVAGTPPDVDHTWVDSYIESMPAAYRAIFDHATVEVHAGIVRRRGSERTRVEVWKRLPEGVVAICVVADDIVGLLSRICAAVYALDADVVAAQAYGRTRPDGEMEAVDFLWIRRAPGASGASPPLRTQDVVRLGETLDALIRGNPSLPRTVRLVRAVRAANRSTRVDFERDERGGSVLAVEADDRPGLLLAITGQLSRERVQIVSSRVETVGKRANDRFVVAELDGTPLAGERQIAVVAAVLEGIDEEGRG